MGLNPLFFLLSFTSFDLAFNCFFDDYTWMVMPKRPICLNDVHHGMWISWSNLVNFGVFILYPSSSIQPSLPLPSFLIEEKPFEVP